MAADMKLVYKLNGKVLTCNELENDDYKLLVKLENERTKIEILAKSEIELVSFVYSKPFEYKKDDRILVNGYQCWTETREMYPHERMIKTNLPFFLTDLYKLQFYGDYWFKKTRKNVLHSYTYSYIKSDDRQHFIGSYNETNAYLIINHHVKENLMVFESDCNGKKVNNSFLLLDFIEKDGDVMNLQKEYFESFRTMEVSKIRGYSSWYNDYQDISEEKIMYALDGIDASKYDLFQIDDGYETFVGDWNQIDPKKFPNGLKGIVDKIHAKGLKAGIWLAPFVCETKSDFFRKHNDLVYKENGKVVYAGSNWSKFMPLDISKPEAIKYIEDSLRYHVDLGFDFFKLDFLYASALVRGTSMTRAEIMTKMTDITREVLKGKLILGCGIQLSSVFGKYEYSRIGPDVSLDFDGPWYMKYANRERVSTKLTIQNSIFRSPMNGVVFGNDPDVYFLRDDNLKLTKEQKIALLTINTLCGSVYLTSDNVKDYDDEKKEIYDSISPLSHAKVLSFDRNGDRIIIKYSLNDEEHLITYNILKGVIE